jgi:hypothetical protein
MLLAGEHELFVKLRKQYEVAVVKDRNFDGCGFFTHFKIPNEFLEITNKRNFTLSDVLIDYGGQEVAYGLILFVDDGFISCLEGFPYISHEWVDDYDRIDNIYYSGKTPNDKFYERDAERIKYLFSEPLR